MDADEDATDARSPKHPLGLIAYELAVSIPIITWIVVSLVHNPSWLSPNGIIPEWQVVVWMAAIATVDLMPVPTTMSNVAFSLSFPIELSVALLYKPPAAAFIALIGSSDPREFKGEIPFIQAVFSRSQIAGAAI